MEQFLEVFFEEAEEHLANLEHLLLTLDIAAPDREALDGIFRAAHSIKGSSGMFGFDDLTAVTHVLETLLDKIRGGKIALRVEMVDVFLQSRDVLGQLLACHKHASADPSIPVAATATRLQALIDSESSTQPPQPSAIEDAYGLFDASPAESQSTIAPPDQHSAASTSVPEDDEFGFFDDQPGAPNQPAQVVKDGLKKTS
ncbi:Hpt domain-containing protein [Pseudomonas anguilliseptica]|uniref:Hpt domain-containing protein n=1 Tax=Pseudomonas anguilliseptica TaxID=53406 RepID=A0A1H4YX23_PSEAG|nr:Hpt domain-containing protein [Pseudomonas anguilliseptica]SED22373.1 Hpt domain-containing protein [Pseudomonas anguilliseptica]